MCLRAPGPRKGQRLNNLGVVTGDSRVLHGAIRRWRVATLVRPTRICRLQYPWRSRFCLLHVVPVMAGVTAARGGGGDCLDSTRRQAFESSRKAQSRQCDAVATLPLLPGDSPPVGRRWLATDVVPDLGPVEESTTDYDANAVRSPCGTNLDRNGTGFAEY